jgi:hypothetical protein
LVGHEAATGQFLDQTFVDRRSAEVELFDVLGQRQLGDLELVADGACLLLGDLGFEQISHNTGWFMLALDARCHDLIIGLAHAIELQLGHGVQDFMAFHHATFRMLS